MLTHRAAASFWALEGRLTRKGSVTVKPVISFLHWIAFHACLDIAQLSLTVPILMSMITGGDVERRRGLPMLPNLVQWFLRAECCGQKGVSGTEARDCLLRGTASMRVVPTFKPFLAWSVTSTFSMCRKLFIIRDVTAHEGLALVH